MLGRYAEGEADCNQALALALSSALHSGAQQVQAPCSSGVPGSGAQQQGSGEPSSTAAPAGLEGGKAGPQGGGAPAGCAHAPPDQLERCLPLLRAAADAAAQSTHGPLAHTTASLDAAEAALSAFVGSLLAERTAAGRAAPAGGAPGWPPWAAPLARLLARRAALRSHLRRYVGARADCRLAAALFLALGEDSKAEQLRADEGVLAGLEEEAVGGAGAVGGAAATGQFEADEEVS